MTNYVFTTKQIITRYYWREYTEDDVKTKEEAEEEFATSSFEQDGNNGEDFGEEEVVKVEIDEGVNSEKIC